MRAWLCLLMVAAALPAHAGETCIDCHAGAAERSYLLSKHGIIARLESGRARTRAPGCGDCHVHEAKHPGTSHYADEAERRQARDAAGAACGRCHAPRYVARQLAAARDGRKIGEMKLREAQQTVEAARREMPGRSLAGIEARFAAMRDEDLRNLRLGLAHQSPDYQWWLGQAALDGALLRVKGALGEMRRGHGFPLSSR